jgi:MFS transporter, DHA1 family, inner membrane transport protein
MTKKERLLIFVLAAIQFTHIMDFMIMMPLGPQLMRLFNINPTQFGLIVSAYTFSAGVSGFLGAFLIDRFDRKKAVQFMYLGFTVGTIACALAPNYMLLVLARALAGMFGGVMSALILSIVGDTFTYERRASAMGAVMAAFSFASVLGVPFGLYLANTFSWHAPFFFIGGLGVIVFVLITLVIPQMNAHVKKDIKPSSPIQVITNITSNPNQLRALLFMVLLMFGQFSIIPFISPYMVKNVGFTEHQLMYIYLIGGGLTIFTSPLIGKMADKYGKPKVFTIFALLTVIPLFLITNMPQIAIGWALLVTSMFFVTVGGRMIPAMTMITSTVKPQNRGSFMSINSSVQQLSASLASFIAGAIVMENADGKMDYYNVVGYIAITAGIIAIFIGRGLKVAEGN